MGNDCIICGQVIPEGVNRIICSGECRAEWLCGDTRKQVAPLVNIGIVGKMGSGKSSLAQYLVANHGYTKASFADPIRLMVKEFLGIEKGDPQYREIMQKVGTDWFRSVDENVWVNYLINNLPSEKVVVDDVRFLNEAERLLENGWMLIYLDCSVETRIERCFYRDGKVETLNLNHPSETSVDAIKAKYESSYNNRFHIVNAELSFEELTHVIGSLMGSVCP